MAEEKINVITGYYDDAARDYGVVTFDGEVLTPEASQKVRNHSPDGFAWGYGGSGPAQLALAILLKFGVPEDKVHRHYQRFKARYLAGLDLQESFELRINIAEWLRENEQTS